MTTIVTLHTLGRTVQGKSYVTRRATQRPATIATLQRGRIASSILEQHNLLASLQSGRDSLLELEVEVSASLASLQGSLGIGDDNVRRNGIAITLQKFGVGVLARQGIIVALE
jgi:hypothetical protein